MSAFMRGMKFIVVGLVASLVGLGCSSDEKSATTSPPTIVATGDTTAPPETDAADTTAAPVETSPVTEPVAPEATTTETEPPETVPETVPDTLPIDEDLLAVEREIIEYLASDELAGRDAGTDGSLAAQEFLIEELASFADPLSGDPSDPESYRSVFDAGTNLLAVIPGSDLVDEYIIVGAHYDHIGSDCIGSGAEDSVCNGATDNAAGVAVALAVGRILAGDEAGPRRSVIIALWDAEEDGLLGSAAYLAAPVVPLEQTVAYVNFDIQGTNISPALRNLTVMVGAETGGPNLVAAGEAATLSSLLDTVSLSLLFGQGRSDHANFVTAGIPSVFFTDATPPCYHTVFDDASIVDYPKLEQQIFTAEALTIDLADTDDLPEFVPNTPAATYDDAVTMFDVLTAAQPDFSRFPAADKAIADQFVLDLGVMVDAGPEAFDAADVGVLLGGTVQIVTLWASGECDGFLE